MPNKLLFPALMAFGPGITGYWLGHWQGFFLGYASFLLGYWRGHA